MEIFCGTNVKRELALDSRDIAKVINVEHKELVETITYYCHFIDRLLKAGGYDEAHFYLNAQDFFIPKKKTTRKGKEKMFYVVTHKGCKLIASGLPKDVRSKFEQSFTNAFMSLQEYFEVPHVPKSDSTLSDLFQYLDKINKTDSK